MNKLYLTLFVLSLVVFTDKVKAQHRISKGDKLLSLYGGFVNPAPFTFSIFSLSGQGSPSPSLNINYQHAVSNKFLIGPFMSYYKVNASITNSIDDFADLFDEPDLSSIIENLDCVILGNCGQTTIGERINVLTLGAKMAYVKNFSKDIESYFSMSIGYSFNRRQIITETLFDEVSELLKLNVGVPTIVYFTSAGVRYAFSNKYAMFGEIGYGNSHLVTLGLTRNFAY